MKKGEKLNTGLSNRLKRVTSKKVDEIMRNLIASLKKDGLLPKTYKEKKDDTKD